MSPTKGGSMSELYQSLSHSKWDCKYHVVFVPKRRRKVIYGQIRRELGRIFHALAGQKECRIIEGHLMPDHVHICIRNPTKTSSRIRDWVSEGKECDCHRPTERQRAKLYGGTFLG